jgi:hypothetical protein
MFSKLTRPNEREGHHHSFEPLSMVDARKSRHQAARLWALAVLTVASPNPEILVGQSVLAEAQLALPLHVSHFTSLVPCHHAPAFGRAAVTNMQ